LYYFLDYGNQAKEISMKQFPCLRNFMLLKDNNDNLFFDKSMFVEEIIKFYDKAKKAWETYGDCLVEGFTVRTISRCFEPDFLEATRYSPMAINLKIQEVDEKNNRLKVLYKKYIYYHPGDSFHKEYVFWMDQKYWWMIFEVIELTLEIGNKIEEISLTEPKTIGKIVKINPKSSYITIELDSGMRIDILESNCKNYKSEE